MKKADSHDIEKVYQVDTAATGEVNEAILAGCRRGDRNSQRRLYELCHQRVYRLMVHMVGVDEAADLTQQVFLQVFRKLDRFSGQSKFETWLYRVAANEALQHQRKHRRRSVPLLREPKVDERRKEVPGENRELLDAALQAVDPQLRSIFLLREVEELSYRDIAQVMGIPEGTVGSRLNRARRELRQQLRNLGWEH